MVVILGEALDICIAIMVVPLATVKSNSSGTTFEQKFFFFFFFNVSVVIILKQIRTFPFEILKSVSPLSAKFTKNNC